MIKRVACLLAGAFVACLANPTYALNGASYVGLCNPCSTTAQFATQAKATAVAAQIGDGTYVITSGSVASTAYMKVTGSWSPHSNRYAASTATPVDASGNSIASQTEGFQEALYHTIDMSVFGVDRGNATVFNKTTGLPQSFINSDDNLITTWLNAAGFTAQYVGQAITICFPDNTCAQYYVAVLGPGGHGNLYQWNNEAWRADGTPIDRSGNIVKNQNTSGAGGGAANTTGFGSSSGWQFNDTGRDICTFVTTITVNGTASHYIHFSAC